jgi:ATP-binding cassette subfamily F protein uup
LLGVTESKSGKADLNSAVVTAAPAPVAAAAEAPVAKKKLSYKLQRELEALPGQIEAMEQQIAAVEAQMADAGFYLRPAAETAAVIDQLAQLQAELDVMVERWAELDA